MKISLSKNLVSLGLISMLAACGTGRPSLVGPAVVVSDVPVTRLFLQQITSTSAILKWRGGGKRVCIAAGETFSKWDQCIDATVEAAADGSSHSLAELRDLDPGQRYFYTVDGRHDPGQTFTTAPAPGSIPGDGNTRILILGDSGMITFKFPPDMAELAKKAGLPDEQIAALSEHAAKLNAGPPHVRDALLRYFSRTEEPDLLLLLGDNAYLDGNDKQWQQAFFDLYASVLKGVAVWPTIGNHEMGSAFSPMLGGMTMGGLSTSSDPASYIDSDEETVDRGMPYLDIFSLPAQGEAGGVASGTEQYYAFDYANVHVVSLDSQLSIRDTEQRQTMKTWLKRDLAANEKDWTIVIFHHPPYTKSSHDSDEGGPITADIDLPIVLIRKELTPIFEEFGVDFVYSGHSHTYERSWYLNGHRGNADSFDPKLHAEVGPSGAPTSGREPNPYRQVTASGKDDRVVYIVAGASSLADVERGTLDHPAHLAFPDGRHGLEVSGAIVLDASRDELTSRYVDTTGTVVDELTIRR